MTDNDREKFFYTHFPERVDALIGNPQLLRVWKRYGPEPFRRSSVLEGFEAFIKAHEFKGGTVCEIGSWCGLTAVVLSRYFDHVVSIDIEPKPEKHEIADFLKIKNIAFIDVKDNAEKADVIKGLTFDAAYSDGDHAKDAEADFALVQRCGNVLQHEHWDPQPAVMELVRRQRFTGAVVTGGKFALWRAA